MLTPECANEARFRGSAEHPNIHIWIQVAQSRQTGIEWLATAVWPHSLRWNMPTLIHCFVGFSFPLKFWPSVTAMCIIVSTKSNTTPPVRLQSASLNSFVITAPNATLDQVSNCIKLLFYVQSRIGTTNKDTVWDTACDELYCLSKIYLTCPPEPPLSIEYGETTPSPQMDGFWWTLVGPKWKG